MEDKAEAIDVSGEDDDVDGAAVDIGGGVRK